MAIFGVLDDKMTQFYKKNRGFWEIFEQIRALYENRDGNSFIHVAFRELH